MTPRRQPTGGEETAKLVVRLHSTTPELAAIAVAGQ
jgi:hypothetical protein